jgi:hypothetical protein
VREHERELVDFVVAETASRRTASADATGPCDFERQFSPIRDLSRSGNEPRGRVRDDELPRPQHSAAELVRDAAYRVVLAELGK